MYTKKAGVGNQVPGVRDWGLEKAGGRGQKAVGSEPLLGVPAGPGKPGVRSQKRISALGVRDSGFEKEEDRDRRIETRAIMSDRDFTDQWMRAAR